MQTAARSAWRLMFTIKALTHCSESQSPNEHQVCYRSSELCSSALPPNFLLCSSLT